MRLRVVAVLLVLAVTAAGFLVARTLTRRDAQDAAEHRAEIAATEVSGGLEQASNLVESLRRFLLGRSGPGVTNAEFAGIGARWLSPVGLPAAAWVERVPARDGRSESLRATLVTGTDPMTAPGIDLSGERALAAAIADERTRFRVTATALTPLRDGRKGIFLVESAPRLRGGVLEPGFAVLFVPGSWLVAEVTEEASPDLEVRVGDTSYGGLGGATPVGSGFTAAGRRFDVLVPREPVRGAAAVLPWLVLGGGILLAIFAGVLSAISERRTRAQREVDRIFTLSPDPIVVVGPEGYFSRVNPAFERLLGYTTEELQTSPVLDFVHPDDRDRSLAEGKALRADRAMLGFENRYLCKDGSLRWLEWTVTRAPGDVVFAMARDVTERRQTESEQAALRRVATLVARAATAQQLFEAVVAEVGRIFDWPWVGLMRYESDDAFVVVATWGDHPFPMGSRWPLDGPSTFEAVLRTGRPARMADYTGVPGAVAEAARQGGILGGVGAPIVVNGKTWGVIAAPITTGRSIPDGAEDRLSRFTELVATAIANAESREALARLAEEQAALRRVATVVAREASQSDVFSAIAEGIGRVLDAEEIRMLRYETDGDAVVVASWGIAKDAFPVGSRQSLEGDSGASRVLRTGRSVRIDDYGAELVGPIAETALAIGIRSVLATPILVKGRPWGAICAGTTRDEPLPAVTEARLDQFSELMATAIANAEARTEVQRLVDEQAALRRVAELVAGGSGPEEVFRAVAAEVGVLFGSDVGAIVRFEDDGTAIVLGDVGGPHTSGKRVSLDPGYVVHVVRETRRSARFDTDDPSAETFSLVRSLGIRSAVASPIVVEGELWGAITAASLDGPLAHGAEQRLNEFTGLIATAIANTQAREQVTTLADEQAALRRVATLVAEGAPQSEVFDTAAREVAQLLGLEKVTIDRYDPDAYSTVVASVNDPGFPLGSRWPLDGPSLGASVLETGRPARIESYADLESTSAAAMRTWAVTSAVGAPILVDGRVWGVICVASTEDARPPDSTEGRLADFTELLATAIARTESREAVARLADEQAALRRVATLVAEGVPSAELFAAVTTEVAHVFSDVDPALVATVIRFDPGPESVLVGGSRAYEHEPLGARWAPKDLYVSTRVLRTGSSARVDEADLDTVGGPDADVLRLRGFLYQVGSPIVVEGQLWGAMCLNSKQELPRDTDERLESFTELVATAIANAESREALGQLVDEQAALRLLATLVAKGVPPTEIFAEVSSQVADVFALDVESSDVATVVRFDPGPECVLVGGSNSIEGLPLGSRWGLTDLYVSARVLRSGRSARVDEMDLDVGGPVAEALRRQNFISQAGSPIFVEGRLWGAMTVNAKAVLPPDAEERLEKFTELVATAIANAESRKARAVLTDEQAALRRVATLVARGAPSTEVFEAVATEVGKLLDTDITVVGRYDGDGAATAIGSWSASGGGVPAGTRSAIGGHNVLTIVAETGKPARVEGYEDASGEAAEIARRFGWRSSIAAPIVVEGRLWGVMLVATQQPEPFPAGAEERLAAFTDLVATAVANTEARHTLERVAAEQAALRRVATLVARGVPPNELFAAVAEEVGQLLPVTSAAMGRYDPDGMFTTVAAWSTGAVAFPVGRRWMPEGRNITTLVVETGRPARIDDFTDASGPIGVIAREAGYRSAVGTPIVVDGRLWGVMTAASSSEQPLPAAIEARLASFTDLVATAIANAEGKSELAASRRRIVAASDDARRRIERDLHDGVQQRLVSLGLELDAMEASLPTDPELDANLTRIKSSLAGVLDDLVEISRGIHPAILSQGGLGPALRTLARRSAIPVELDAQIDGRLPEPVEVAAYYVVSEALTNAAKHAHASVVHIGAATENGAIRLSIRDDGIGGADPNRGSGLAGLQDRVEALGGKITFESTPDKGTTLLVTLPADPASTHE